MKKLVYPIVVLGIVSMGLLTGCQQKSEESNAPSMEPTNAPAMPSTNGMETPSTNKAKSYSAPNN